MKTSLKLSPETGAGRCSSQGPRVNGLSLPRLLLTLLALCAALAPLRSGAQVIDGFQVIQSFVPTNDAGATLTNGAIGGLAFDGTDLWVTIQGQPSQPGTNRLCRINPETKRIAQCSELPFTPAGVACAGPFLWVFSIEEGVVVRYDRDCRPWETNHVAVSRSFPGLTWDGTNLWGAASAGVFRIEATGDIERGFFSCWYQEAHSIAWDGANLWCWGADTWGGAATRIDPETGHVRDFYPVPHLADAFVAIGAQRLWLCSFNAQKELLIRELYFPAPAPIPPGPFAWGQFSISAYMGLPLERSSFSGSGLGAFQSNFWYANYNVICPLRWDDKSRNTGQPTYDRGLIGYGGTDITSDGENLWIVSQPDSAWPPAVSQLTLSGEFIHSFTVKEGRADGIAWDGEALWIGGGGLSGHAYPPFVARYDTAGNELVRFALPEIHGFGVDDLAWLNGELWVYGEVGIVRISPSTGALLGIYECGAVPFNSSGIASDGQNLYACVNLPYGPDPALLPSIVRLDPLHDLEPPRISGLTAKTNYISILFAEALQQPAEYPWYVFHTSPQSKDNYVIECPIGSPLDLSASGIFFARSPNAQVVTLCGLPLVQGQPVRVTVRRLLDLTGNMIREDGIANTAAAIVEGPPITNSPPAVRITSPANGARARAGLPITVSAEAADPDGTVSRVDFYADGRFIGSTATFPYTMTIGNLAAGPHALTAAARDSSGVTVCSAPVSVIVVPANDAFADRLEITSADPQSYIFVTGSNVGATREPGEPYHCGLPSNKSVWWSFTAPRTGRWVIKVWGLHDGWIDWYPSYTDTLLSVYTGSSVSNLTLVACNDDVEPPLPVIGIKPNLITSMVAFDAVAGTDYQIAVAGLYVSERHPDEGTLYLTLYPPLLNDDFEGRLPIVGLPATVTGHNVGATNQPGEPYRSRAESVWWSWTAPADAKVVVSLEGSSCQGGLGVYTGTELSRLVTVAQGAGSVPFDALGGTTYTIAVYGWAVGPAWPDMVDGTGRIILHIATVATNDNFAERIVLSGDRRTATGHNFGATAEPGEPLGWGYGSWGSGMTVWWSWTAPNNGRIAASLEARDFSGFLTVWTGSVVSNLTQIGYLSSEALVCFEAVAGTTYHFQVDGSTSRGTNWGVSGDMVLTLNWLPEVTILRPTNGAVFAMPANITVEAEALDRDDGVAQVDFYCGSTWIGTATNGPYSVTWSNVVDGSNTLTAVATDLAGNASTSAPVRVWVTAPNDAFANSTVLSGVSVLAFGANVNASKEPGEPDHAGSPGGHSVWYSWTAPATGEVGAGVAEATFGWALAVYTGGSVSNLAAVARATAWPWGTSTSFRATAGTTYHLALDGQKVGGLGNAMTGAFSLSLSLNVAPVVTLTSPPDGAAFAAPTNLTLTAEASDSDGSVAQVEFRRGGTILGTVRLGTVTNAPYSLVWSNVPAGSYTLTAKATDNLGCWGTSAPVRVTVGAPYDLLPTALRVVGLDGGGMSNVVGCAGPYAESAHPYANNTDQSWTNQCPGADVLEVTFDSRCAGESWRDRLHVMDGNGDPIGGSPFDLGTLAGQTMLVLGDTVRLRLTSDGSVTGWGFAVTEIRGGQWSSGPVVASMQPNPRVGLFWRVTNAGSGSAAGTWTDWVYFSTNATLDAQDQGLTGISKVGTVPAGAGYSQFETVTLPVSQSGTYYLILQVNRSDTLAEANETNNTMVVPVTIELPLRITSIQLVGTDVRLSFTTLAGATYRLERTAVLAPASVWTPVPGADNITGTGGIVTATDSGGATQPCRFYRVRRVQ